MNFGSGIQIVELIGIIAFALSGAIVAMKRNFDIFGIIVLGVMTAVGGGAIRDIILGIIPPNMFRNSLYVFVAFLTCVLAFLLVRLSKRISTKQIVFDLVNFFDAIGLGVFAVTGTNAALVAGYQDNAFLAIFVGVVTGIGGGMVRDILAMKIPFVLYKDIYASAAIVGASLYYILFYFGVKNTFSVTIAIVLTILIRMSATWFHLGLPKVKK